MQLHKGFELALGKHMHGHNVGRMIQNFRQSRDKRLVTHSLPHRLGLQAKRALDLENTKPTTTTSYDAIWTSTEDRVAWIYHKTTDLHLKLQVVAIYKCVFCIMYLM